MENEICQAAAEFFGQLAICECLPPELVEEATMDGGGGHRLRRNLVITVVTTVLGMPFAKPLVDMIVGRR